MRAFHPRDNHFSDYFPDFERDRLPAQQLQLGAQGHQVREHPGELPRPGQAVRLCKRNKTGHLQGTQEEQLGLQHLHRHHDLHVIM